MHMGNCVSKKGKLDKVDRLVYGKAKEVKLHKYLYTEFNNTVKQG